MVDPDLAMLAAMIREMEPCKRLRLAIGLIEEARATRSADPLKARSQLVLAGTIARTVSDEITALDVLGKLHA